MMTSSNIYSHDLLIDHPFSGSQLVTPSDHDHGHGGHYCHNWISHHHHHHHNLDLHINKQVGSDHHDGLNNHTMDAENGSIETWTWEHNNDLYNYDPMVGSVDHINSDDDEIHDNWLPNSSKLKVVKKMNPKRASNSNTMPPMEIATDEYFPYFLQADQNDSNSINSGSNGNQHINNGIRVCSDCHTTKTPLWRSGPNGPKSLCNACGIRQRKARRALAAAAAGGGSSVNNALQKATTTSNPKSLKIKVSDNTNEKKTSTTCGYEDTTQGWQQPYKKRLKHHHHHHQNNSYTSPSASQDSNGDDDDRSGERNDNKRMCFEEFITISLSKNAALHRVFPQDEKEAAILLMAMSCGLVHN